MSGAFHLVPLLRHKAGEAIIGGLRLADFLFVEVAVVVEKARDILEFAVVGGLSICIADRQVDFVRVIHLVECFGAAKMILQSELVNTIFLLSK